MKTIDHTNRKTSAARGEAGFTLAELLVVAGIIGLMLAIVLPSVRGLFTAGADLHAAAEISAMSGAARGTAISNQTFAILHLEMGADKQGWTGASPNRVPVNPRCWASVLKYEWNADALRWEFVPSDEIAPRMMPGDVALGEVSAKFVPAGSAFAITAATLDDFTTFNVIFASDGSMTTMVNGGNPVLANKRVPAAGAGDLNASRILWQFDDATQQAAVVRVAIYPALTGIGEAGVRAMTIFDYKGVKAAKDDATRTSLLNKTGQFLVINPDTGQLIPPE